LAYIQDMKIKMKSISTHKKQTDYTKWILWQERTR